MQRLILAGLALALSGATALAQSPSQQFSTVNVETLLNASKSLTGSYACDSKAGHRAMDGTYSWEPTCFGVFAAPGMDIYTGLTRGNYVDDNGVPSYGIATPLLVQAQAIGDRPLNQSGMLINMDILGGSVSQGGLDSTNTTGQLISLRQRPGPNGEKPPSTWGHNIDLHIAPGAGNVLSFGVEYDQNNFNKDCAPGGGCLSTSMFFNGISGVPNTSYLFAGTPSTGERTTNGSVSGNVVTRSGGPSFESYTTLVTINGTRYRVRYLDGDHVTAEG